MSNSFNGVVRAGRDAEVRFIPSGTAIMNVTVASSTGFGDKQKTLWIRLNYWGKAGEKVAQYITKGCQFWVSGELSQNEYEKDGVTHTSLELNVTAIDLVGGKPQTVAQQAPQQRPHDPDFDDDIPFS